MSEEKNSQDSGLILVVDDEDRNRKLLRRVLESKGYKVIEAVDGEDALQKVEEVQPDTLLLDVMMPKLDGFEVCRRLKAAPETTHIPILMVTMLSSREDRLAGIEAGADDFLSKPVDIEETILRVKNAVLLKKLYDENLSFRRNLEKKVAEQTMELREAHDILARQVKELEARDRLVQFQMKGVSIEEANREIVLVAQEALQAEQTVLYSFDNDRKIVEPVINIDLDGPGDRAEQAMILAGRAAMHGEPAVGDDGGAAVAMKYRDEVLGVLWCRWPNRPQDETLAMLSRLAVAAALVLRSARVSDDLTSGMINMDELLGLAEES